MMRLRGEERAFTLIEVLIACGLIVVIGLALYQAFSQGTKVWNRAVGRQPDIDYLIFIEKFSHDLQNSFIFTNEKFQGDNSFVEFNTLNTSRGGGREEVFRIRYAYDASSHSIKKMAWDYKEILTHHAGRTSVALGKIESLKMEFYRSEKGTNPEWVNRYEAACLPEAVKVLVDYYEGNAKKSVSRVIPLIHGGCGN